MVLDPNKYVEVFVELDKAHPGEELDHDFFIQAFPDAELAHVTSVADYLLLHFLLLVITCVRHAHRDFVSRIVLEKKAVV